LKTSLFGWHHIIIGIEQSVAAHLANIPSYEGLFSVLDRVMDHATSKRLYRASSLFLGTNAF
jgi:hypothetical protein